MHSIVVVGSLAYDSISTPTGRVDRALGGSANYFSVAASIFSPVKVVGVVGEDYAKQDLEKLTKRGVDTSGMTQVKGKTFHWEGKYEGDLNEAQTLKTDLNVFEHFDPKLPDNYKDSQFVFLANIDPDLQLKVLEQVRTPLLVGSDTMNLWINIKKSALEKVLERIHALIINEGEAKLLTGAPNAIAAAQMIHKMGPKIIVIKRGEYGFVMYGPEGFFMLPAVPIAQVVDPTGAGDSFAGGFFGYLASVQNPFDLKEMKRACVYGTVMASFTVQGFGLSELEKVTKERLNERLSHYESCTR